MKKTDHRNVGRDLDKGEETRVKRRRGKGGKSVEKRNLSSS